MKYFIHDHYGRQQSLIDTLPSGYTALDYETQTRIDTIAVLPDYIDVSGIPSVITEEEMRFDVATNDRENKWLCIHVENCSDWSEIDAEIAAFVQGQDEAHARLKAHVESL
jgi:hypothetical protein